MLYKFDNRLFQKAEMCQAATNKDNNCTDVKIEIATVHVFIDGTLNNLYNTDLRLRGIRSGEGTSYNNDYTNVAWLFKAAEQTKSVYVQGMGTEYNKKDSSLGYGLGRDATGVEVRAKQTFAQVVIKAKAQQKRKDKPIQRLHLNVFGFSRGAATARYFVHLATTQPELFVDLNLSASDIYVNFMGLFDTVVSVGDGVSLSGHQKSFDEPNSRTPQTIPVKNIKKVFHLAARDEFRLNFSLTRIQSAGNKGFEMFIPGAHSDIGGSYVNGSTERQKWSNYEKAYMDYVISKGWYKAGEIKAGSFPNNAVFFASRVVMNEYFKVGLKLMERMVALYAPELKFSGLPTSATSDSPSISLVQQGFLAELNARHREGGVLKVDLPINVPSHTSFYSRYLHISSSAYATGMAPRLGSDGKPYRHYIQG